MIKWQKMKLDFFFTTVLVLLITIGILMVFSASSILAIEAYDNIYFFFKKHILNLVLGIVAMIIVAKIPYQTLRGLIPFINIVTIILLVLVLIPGFTMTVNGAGRWLSIGGFSFQPSEIAKITVIFTLSHMIELRRRRKTLNRPDELIKIACYLGIYLTLIFFEKHLSAVGIIVLVSMVLLLIGGIHKKYFVVLSAAVLSLGVVGVIIEPFRMKRIFGFLNPEANPLGDGYHVIQSFYALGSGNLFGLGLGMSRQKSGWLPENHTDFILSIIGEELGFIGIAGVIFLFVAFMFRGLKIAFHAPDEFGTLITTGIVVLITMQAMINMAVVSGLAPVTGMPLPFISYGGSSTIILLTGVGLVFNVANQVKYEEEIE